MGGRRGGAGRAAWGSGCAPRRGMLGTRAHSPTGRQVHGSAGCLVAATVLPYKCDVERYAVSERKGERDRAMHTDLRIFRQ